MKWGCDVNIRSIQDDEVFDICRFFYLLLQTKLCCYIFNCISFVTGFVMTIPVFDLAFKSPINTIRNGLFWPKLFKINSRLSMSFLQILPPIFNSKLMYSCRYWILRTRKGKVFVMDANTTAFIVWKVIRAY